MTHPLAVLPIQEQMGEASHQNFKRSEITFVWCALRMEEGHSHPCDSSVLAELGHSGFEVVILSFYLARALRLTGCVELPF